LTRRLPGVTDRRTPVRCDGCGTVLAYIRPDWLFLRRFLCTDAAVSHERKDGGSTLRCRCGATTTVRWALIQF
jgi:hypothetical protein